MNEQIKYNTLIQRYHNSYTGKIKTQHPEFYDFIVNMTAFLPPSVTTTQRLWHIHNNLFSVPLCKTCNTPVNWDIVKQDYRKYCCRMCSPKKSAEDHGTPPQCNNSNCTELVHWNSNTKKWNNTCSHKCKEELSRNTMSSLEEMNSVLSALPSDYNYRNFIAEHRSVVNRIHYETTHLPTSYQIKKRIGWLLGRTKTKREIINTAITSLDITNEEDILSSLRYARALISSQLKKDCLICGAPRQYNSKTGRFRKYCGDGCAEKHKKQILLKQFVKKLTVLTHKKFGPSNKNHDNRLNSYEWLYDHHYNKKWSKQRISKELNVDKETITNRFNLLGITSIRHSSNNAEQEIVDFLKSIYNDQIILNTRTIIGPKELDIFLPNEQLAIEYCGLYWHSDVHDRITRSYHKQKYQLCKKQGIRLITIFEDEWLHHPDIVKSKLKRLLKINDQNTVYARNTKVIQLSSTQYKPFLNEFHIQGNKDGSVVYGLTTADQIVAVVVFKQLKPNTWSIERYATSINVPGGFTKLLSYFQKHHTWNQIITFADLRWSEGDLYKLAGFTIETIIPPDYSYINQTTTTRHHKFGYRHKFLSTKLAKYDKNVSEAENMKNNNIYRIWDCGKIKYVININQLSI